MDFMERGSLSSRNYVPVGPENMGFMERASQNSIYLLVRVVGRSKLDQAWSNQWGKYTLNNI